MRTPEEWVAEVLAQRPDDFGIDDHPEMIAGIARIQADARTYSDAELERMAAAGWDRVATIKWHEFFTGPREPLKGRYIEDMRAALAAAQP